MKKLKQSLFYIITLFILLSGLNTSYAAPRTMNLYVGQVKPVSVGKVTRVAVGKDSLLQTIILDDGKVLFIPTAAGETDVKIWLKNGKYRDYKFNIMAANMGGRKVIAQSLLRTFPRLRVTSVDKYIIIEGKISPIDQKIYEAVIGKIENVVSLVNPNLYNEYQTRQLIKAFDIKSSNIKKAGRRLILSGEIDPQNLKAFEAVVSKIPNITSLIRPQVFVKEKMVRLKVHVVEVDSNFGRQLGIKWDESSQGPSFGVLLPVRTNNGFPLLNSNDSTIDEGESNPQAFFGLQTSIFSRLNFLESNGKAKTLSRPELLARSGSPATFNVGGELPIVSTNSDGQTEVEFKPYGVNVNMMPLINRNNEIVLQLTTEVSSVDTTTTVLGVPGLKTAKATTTINARSGQTISIAGLLDVTSGQDKAKVPLLGDIPILGSIFKTKGKTSSKRELVFLITPELVGGDNLNNAPLHLRNEVKRLESHQVPLDRDIKGSNFVTDILE